MTKNVLAVIKVYPEGDDSSIEDIRAQAEKVLPPGHKIGKADEEELAFGLKCLVLYIIMPEETEGGTEPLEKALSTIKGVGRVETEMVTRYRAQLC